MILYYRLINPVSCTRFCVSNVISYGHTFLDIILQVTYVIRATMVISHSPPDPRNRTYAEHVLRHAGVGNSTGGKDRTQKGERLTLFLTVFNGDWTSKMPTHHCSVFCHCGGMPREQLVELAADLFVEIVLNCKPSVPALNRWLRCAETARWYVWLV